MRDPSLYEKLALVDALRDGPMRETQNGGTGTHETLEPKGQ